MSLDTGGSFPPQHDQTTFSSAKKKIDAEKQAQAVTRFEGAIEMWANRAVMWVNGLFSTKMKNKIAVSIANKVFDEFKKGQYGKGIAHLNHMSETQLKAFYAKLDIDKGLKENVLELLKIDDKGVMTVRIQEYQFDGTPVFTENLAVPEIIVDDSEKAERIGVRNWRNVAIAIHNVQKIAEWTPGKLDQFRSQSQIDDAIQKEDEEYNSSYLTYITKEVFENGDNVDRNPVYEEGNAATVGTESQRDPVKSSEASEKPIEFSALSPPAQKAIIVDDKGNAATVGTKSQRDPVKSSEASEKPIEFSALSPPAQKAINDFIRKVPQAFYESTASQVTENDRRLAISDAIDLATTEIITQPNWKLPNEVRSACTALREALKREGIIDKNLDTIKAILFLRSCSALEKAIKEKHAESNMEQARMLPYSDSGRSTLSPNEEEVEVASVSRFYPALSTKVSELTHFILETYTDLSDQQLRDLAYIATTGKEITSELQDINREEISDKTSLDSSRTSSSEPFELVTHDDDDSRESELDTPPSEAAEKIAGKSLSPEITRHAILFYQYSQPTEDEQGNLWQDIYESFLVAKAEKDKAKLTQQKDQTTITANTSQIEPQKRLSKEEILIIRQRAQEARKAADTSYRFKIRPWE